MAKYIFPKIVIDPIKPSDNLYNAEYEHKKEVFGHKVAKDFIIREKKDQFSKGHEHENGGGVFPLLLVPRLFGLRCLL